MPFARQMPPNTKQNFTDIWETLDEKLCWSRERTLRDHKERNKGLPVSQASVGGWSKCNPKYSILYLYIFQDVWSCLYSGFCLNCHVCGCHFGLQVIPALFEWRGIIIIIIIISQPFFIQIIINNIILINSNSEAEDNMITCSYNLTCGHTHAALYSMIHGMNPLSNYSVLSLPPKSFVLMRGTGNLLDRWGQKTPLIDALASLYFNLIQFVTVSVSNASNAINAIKD